jgi:chemotaxis protein methyltransferase CheR
VNGDTECTAFLQWALPLRNLRWPGFRKVRRQVCKRLKCRMEQLGIADFTAYRAARARCEGRAARIWSAGCASGEEPYTLKILWDLEVMNSYPDVSVSILATDVDEAMLKRAQSACFEATSLHELPRDLIDKAFDRTDSLFCVRQQHHEGVDFAYQDVRSEAPTLCFDLILCRYVAFTYFAQPLQRQVLARLVHQLLPNGYLLIGTHEQLPGDDFALTPLADSPQIFTRASGSISAKES